MAVTGNQLDLYVRKYGSMIEHAFQTKGGILRNLVTLEGGLMGERNYFNKIGQFDGATEQTDRFGDLQIIEANFERRFITPRTFDSATALSELDLIRYADSPQADIVLEMAKDIGRKEDDFIIKLMDASALREVAGASSNAAFDTTNQRVAVSSVAFSDVSAGNVMLHEGKIMSAIQILQANGVDVNRDEVYVIASAKQLTNLKFRLMTKGYATINNLNNKPMTIPGMDTALDGFHGLRFIQVEQLANSDNLSGSYEKVYVFAKSALKVGFYQDLNVRIFEDLKKRDNPIVLKALETMGGVRMHDEALVQILCTTS